MGHPLLSTASLEYGNVRLPKPSLMDASALRPVGERDLDKKWIGGKDSRES